MLRDLKRGLAALSEEQREALLLVGMEQYSYQEAAKIAGLIACLALPLLQKLEFQITYTVFLLRSM